MADSNRRDFVKATSATAVLGASVFAARGLAADDQRLRIAYIGCGGRANSLLGDFKDHTTAAWVCDPDAARVADFQKRSGAAKTTGDFRQALADASVDAVVISTPDHWHAPAAILACAAGKHVYVEKPCSHNLREGRLLVEAARRHKVIVQHGTQSRSNPQIAQAMAMLQEGLIGEVVMAKAWNVQRRKNIGHASPTEIPSGVDYDTWVGPAEWMPFQPNRFHYDWHWWHNFGTGDIGNDGTHEIDMARWGLGVTGLPKTVAALGGKYYFDDDQQFPDSATCCFEWPGDGSVGQRKQLIFEMRIWSKNYPHNCDTGIEFYGTKGMMFVSKRGKLQVWDDTNQLLKDPRPQQQLKLASSHQVDFIEAIHEGRRPAADIAIGHDSVCLVHLANLAIRTGRSLQIDPASESIVGDDAANQLLGRTYRDDGHWGIPKV